MTMTLLRAAYRELLEKRHPHQFKSAEESMTKVEEINQLVRAIREEMALSDELTENDRIALAWFLGMDRYELSYSPEDKEYKLNRDKELHEAYEKFKVSQMHRCLLQLSLKWTNDLQSLFDDVLSGKEIIAV